MIKLHPGNRRNRGFRHLGMKTETRSVKIPYYIKNNQKQDYRSRFFISVFFNSPLDLLRIMWYNITVNKYKTKGYFEMKKLSFILAVLMVLTCVLASCGEKESGGLSISGGGAASTTQVVTGLCEETYTLEKNISKVVSLSPAASMIIDTLGASSKLIGVDAESAKYLSSAPATTKPADAASLAPEVIFVDEADKAAIGTTDIPVFVIPTATAVADITSLIRLCGKVTGVNVDSLVSKVTNALNVAQMGSAEYTVKRSTYIDMNGETVGSGTYITEMLHATGLENICTGTGFCTMSEADVVAANPEMIFTTGKADSFLNNAAFANVDAVVNGQVFEIEYKDIRYASSNICNVVSTFSEKSANTRSE